MLTGYNTPEYNPALLASEGAYEAKTRKPEPFLLTENTVSPIRQGGRSGQNFGYEIPSESMPVDISADSLVHDDATQTIIARGHVEIEQAGRWLSADEVSYNLSTDSVVARGHVVLHEVNGDVHFADEVSLTENMKRGYVAGLNSYLSEGGHFSASEGDRIAGKTVTMRDAAYTPCDCETDDDGTPVWQIKADEVVYHEDENRISYKNARFEMFGVPMLWTPYLSHPDGKVKRKSGFLSPEFGYYSELGAFVTPRYYWNIATDKDATFGLMTTTQEYPVFMTEYRQRFAEASIILDGSLGYAAYTDSVDEEDVRQDEKLRGHFFGEGRWDINNKWRAGFDIEKTSDDQYLRQFDISGKDLLESEVYLERFSGRNYAVARGVMFDDTRIDVVQDQPDILPEIVASFYGEPNALLGGRWSLNASALGLVRDGSGQDMSRLVLEGGWQRRDIFDFGLVTTTDIQVRGDTYQINDKDVASIGSGRSTDGTETRGNARAHLEVSYPMVRNNMQTQTVIEPVVSVTVNPNINVADSNIPNEDSQDVQIDASNIFSPDRFPGKDRIEDGSHATYGLHTGVYGYEGSYINLFLGQSHRFDNDVLFPEGSGLTEQQSDIVGQVAAVYKDDYGLDYRFQIANNDLSSQRHELDAHGQWDRLSLRTRYLFAKAISGQESSESREQLETSGSFKVTEQWRLKAGTLYDLGEEPGLRKAQVGVDFAGCCMSFSLAAKRNLTTDSSGDSGTDVTFRLGLKNIGEFQALGDGSSGF